MDPPNRPPEYTHLAASEIIDDISSLHHHHLQSNPTELHACYLAAHAKLSHHMPHPNDQHHERSRKVFSERRKEAGISSEFLPTNVLHRIRISDLYPRNLPNAKRKGLQYGLPDLCTYSLEHMHRGSSSPNPPSCRVPRINSTRSPDRCIYVLGLTEDLQALRLACSSAEIILAGL